MNEGTGDQHRSGCAGLRRGAEHDGDDQQSGGAEVGEPARRGEDLDAASQHEEGREPGTARRERIREAYLVHGHRPAATEPQRGDEKRGEADADQCRPPSQQRHRDEEAVEHRPRLFQKRDAPGDDLGGDRQHQRRGRR